MKFNCNQSIHRVISLGPSELYKKIVWRVARRFKVFLFKTKKHPLNLTEKSIDDRISFVNLSYLTQSPFETNKNIIDKADDICRNKFHIHEVGCISWDTKTMPWDTWEPLNVRLFHRHDFLILLVRAFNLTQSHKYRDCIKKLLPDLIRNYPVDMIMRYDKTIDIAIRILNWSAICSLTGKNVWSKDHLNYWLLQIEWMKANLSPGGNHRLIEGVGLFAAGLYFGEISNAKKWELFGKEIVLKEMERQVFEDGIHAEQSLYYHIVCTTLFLKFYLLCKKANIQIERNFSNRLQKMMEYVAYSQKPNGKHPMIGDGCEIGEIYEREHWEGMALLPAFNQLFNKDVILDGYQRDAFGWFMEPTSLKDNDGNNALFNLRSKMYEKSGHAVFQNNSGQYLYFNCGPFGFPPHPHHGHADALSVEICLNSQDLILDCGGYAYRNDKYRQYVRGTSAHNTIEINGKNQSHVYGVFGVGKTATTKITTYKKNHQKDLIQGEHDGYYPIIHRRKIIFIKQFFQSFVIIDQVSGSQNKICKMYYHLAPGIKNITKDTNNLHFFKEKVFVGSGCFFANCSSVLKIIKRDCSDGVQGLISKRTGLIEFRDIIEFQTSSNKPTTYITIFTPYKNLRAEVIWPQSKFILHLDEKNETFPIYHY